METRVKAVGTVITLGPGLDEAWLLECARSIEGELLADTQHHVHRVQSNINHAHTENAVP